MADGALSLGDGSGRLTIGGRASGDFLLESPHAITINDANTNGEDLELGNYPINWKAIQKVTSSSMLIGVYHTNPGTGGGTSYMNTIGFMCTSQNATKFYYIDPSTGSIKSGDQANFTNYMNLYQ